MAHKEDSIRTVWLIFLLLSGPIVSVRAAGSVCDTGCPQETFPVCGRDGEWYQNECIAVCAGVLLDAHLASCQGTPMPFDDAKPGPNGAESGSDVRKVVPRAVIDAFKSEGLRYIGRIKLAREMGPRPTSTADQPEPDSDGRGNWRVDAVRCTSEGDVYRGTMLVPMKASVITAAEPRPVQNWFKKGTQTLPPAAADRGQLVQESGSYVEDVVLQEHAQAQRPLGSLVSALRGVMSGFSKLLWSPDGWRGPAAAAAAERATASPADLIGDNLLLESAALAGGSSSTAERSQQPEVAEQEVKRQPPASGGASMTAGNSSSSSSSSGGGGGGAGGRVSSSRGSGGNEGDSAAAAVDSGDAAQEDLDLVAEYLGHPGMWNISNDPSSPDSSSNGDRHRRLLEIIGADNRFDCDRSYPYTAIGQIQVVDNTGLYICTGTLIKPDKVLTAAHCVWNTKRNAFYYNLNFSPGRYRDKEGMVNPWGIVAWKSVTVFDSFKKNPATWDVAVVTLSKKLGTLTGYMGMAAGCSSQTSLTVAGYPQDQLQGTCMANICKVPYLDCNALTNTHTCDTIMGMSGSPLWDSKNRIRMIHVAGIAGKDENRATTVTQFLVNTISKW